MTLNDTIGAHRRLFRGGAFLVLMFAVGCDTMQGGVFAGTASTPVPQPRVAGAAVNGEIAPAESAASAPNMKTSTRKAGAVDLEALSEGGALFSAIPEPALPDASCGMILWTLDDQEPTPILRYVVGKGAEIALAGSVVPLEVIDTAGSSRYGVAEEQAFQGPNGVSLNVRVSFGLGFDGGQYLERSIITIEDDAGWRNVTPAAGLAGCRRK